MKKFISSLAFIAASTLLGSQAFAGLTTWTNIKDVNTMVGVLGNHSYTHDLKLGSTLPFAFQPNGMTALSGSIGIEIFEDICTGRPLACLGNAFQEALSPEIVMFQIEDFDMDTGSIQLGLSDFAASLGINALASINTDGMLNITVQSLGDDFRIGKSTLSIAGVPEPEMLGLMGFALLSLGLAQRRRNAQA